MKYMIERGMAAPRCFGLETICMPNWNLLQDSLEKGTVDAAFILAPAAMDLFNYGVPLRLIMFAHRNGSIMVRTKSAEYRKPHQQFFKHKTMYIPYKMSVQHMLAHKYFSEMGLKPGMQSGREAINLRFDVVAPVNMPEFLAESPDACGFMVAEPIGSRAIAAGIAERHLLSSEIWENHPCCVVVFRKDYLDRHTDAVYEFSDLLVKAGLFISDKPDEAAQVAVSFLDPQGKIGLQVPILKKVLTDPMGITTTDLYPSIEDLDAIQRYMVEKMNVGQMTDLETFVDLRFADAACPVRMALSDAVSSVAVNDVARQEAEATGKKGAGRQARRADLFAASEEKIVREGKYLIFVLAGERYGIPVLDVREITQMMPFRSVPRMPAYVRGVINLRDKVIPVLDMRAKFGLAPVPYTDRMCIIIVNVASFTGSTQIGFVMDDVLEVTDIKEEGIQDTPDFGKDFRYDSIIGIAQVQNKVVTLLDIERAIGTQEQSAPAMH
jgi:chemotaxis signal transduction protein/ABC-type nitrate/sulfonate/bicarbonate transport system substrate-binding protein